MSQRQPVPPSRRKSRWGLISIAVLVAVALIAGLLYWINRPTDPAAGSYRDIGGNVSVKDGAPEGLKATPQNISKPPLKGVEALGDVMHVTPDGQLKQEITLRFKLNRKIDDPRDVVVAVNRTGKVEDWQLVAPTRVEGEYAYVTTNHLSWWQPLWRSFTELVNAALGELQKQWDGLTDGAFAQAEKPKCDDEQAARDKGYSIKWSGAEVLYWCLGLDHGKPVVRISNKRSYPIFVNHKGISVPDKPKSKFDLELLGRQTFSSDRTVLMATDQLQLNYDLGKGQSKAFTTEYNGFAESLYQLQFGVTTLLNILTRYGAGGGGKVAETMSKLLQDMDCVASLNAEGNVGQVINGCFDPAKIIKIFGWQGVLVAMVMIAAPVVEFFRNTFDTLGDLLSGKDRETVTVSYNPPPPAPSVLFVGKWIVHGAVLTIKKDGTGSYSWNAGPCPTPGNEYNMCTGNAEISFKVNGEIMVGTYRGVWFTTADGSAAPSDHSTAGPKPGKSFTLKRNDAHTLISSGTADDDGPGNPYLCDEYAMQRNNTPEYNLCGA